MVLRVKFGFSEDLHKVLNLADLVEFVAEVLGLELHEQRAVGYVVLDFSFLAFPEFLIDHELLADSLHVLVSLGLKSCLIVHKSRRTLDSLGQSFCLVISFHFFSSLQLFLVQFELKFLSSFFFSCLSLQS